MLQINEVRIAYSTSRFTFLDPHAADQRGGYSLQYVYVHPEQTNMLQINEVRIAYSTSRFTFLDPHAADQRGGYSLQYV